MPLEEPARPDARRATFVGRTRELRLLLQGLDQAVTGRGRLFDIVGEPGIGKTSLAMQVAEAAEGQSARLLWGRCWEAGGEPSFWPWVQSIRSYLRTADPDLVRRQLGSGGPSVARLVPELAELMPELAGSAHRSAVPHDLDADSARFRMFDDTTRFLWSVAQDRPLVLIFDDLHAADTPSLLLLEFAARDLLHTGVLIVALSRDVDPGHPLASTRVELARNPGAVSLHLHGLSEPDVGQMIEDAIESSPPPSVISSVFAGSEGNPLFVGEMIRLLVEQGSLHESDGAGPPTFSVPEGIRDVIGRRLEHLSDDRLAILRCAAVIGREFDLAVLEGTTGVAIPDLLAELDQAAAAQLAGEVPGSVGRWRFAHALIRDVLYGDLTRTERVRTHRAVVSAIVALHESHMDPYLAELAHHSFQAASGGDADDAVEFATRAGDRAARLLAYEDAARLYRMALQALDLRRDVDRDDARVDLLLALGDSLTRAGDTVAAQPHLLEAIDIARTRRMPDRLARAALTYGGRFVWSRAGADPRIVPLLREAIATVPQEDVALRVRLLARLAGALRDQPNPEPRDSISSEAVELARRADDPATLAYALEARVGAVMSLENSQDRLSITTELLDLSEGLDDERIYEAHINRLICLWELGDRAGADLELVASTGLANALRQPAQTWQILVLQTMSALFDGRMHDAEELVERAMNLGRTAQTDDALVAYRMQRFMLLKELDQLEGVYGTVRSWVRDHPARSVFRCVAASVCAELDHVDEARAVFESLAVDDFAGLPKDNEWLLQMSLLAEVCVTLHDTRHASWIYERLTPYAGRIAVDVPEASTGSVARPLGMLATELGRWGDAAAHFEEAITANRRLGSRSWVAHSQHEFARMLLSRAEPGDRERAEELLTEVVVTAEELGLEALRRRATELTTRWELDMAGSAHVETLPDDAANTFRREGEYWSITFEGVTSRMKHSKGLGYLAHLLATPGHETTSLELVTSGAGRRGGRTAVASAREAGLRIGSDSGGPVLDERAKQEYRRRRRELEAELEEADSWADAERAANLKTEIDFLERELAAAVGLAGRDRSAPSDAERARISVTKAIRAAIERIREHDPSLAAHLATTVHTGTLCSYAPDPRVRSSWQF